MGDAPSDRRRAERVDVNTGFQGFGEGIYVSNLSEYGLFVQSNHLVPLGTDIVLQFTVVLDDPVVLRGRGKVVRHQTDPVGMGVEFTELDPEMILRINDVITRERPRDLGQPLPAEQGDEHSSTRVDSVRDVVLQTANLQMSTLAGGRSGRAASADDPEAAQTLMNLSPVDVEIIEDDDLPQDDGRPLRPKGRR